MKNPEEAAKHGHWPRTRRGPRRDAGRITSGFRRGYSANVLFPQGVAVRPSVWFVATARRCDGHRHRRGACHAGGRTDNAVLPGFFNSLLEPGDLARLRTLTRWAHRAHNPTDRPLTDFECDEVIDALGPEAAAETLRDAVDTGTLH